MAGRNYWLDLFTPVTWQEFLDAGAKVSGFREARWSTPEAGFPGGTVRALRPGAGVMDPDQ